MLLVSFFLLLLSLVSFGAVLPHSWLGLALVWTLSFVVLTTVHIARKGTVDIRILALAVAGIVFASLVNLKVALGILSLAWAWAASRGRPASILTFYKFLVVIGTLEALLGFVQSFISPGWIFGYINTFYRVSGTLINRNHFAGLMEMLIPPALGLALVSASRQRELAKPYLYLLCAGVMGLGIVLSLSRMGLFSFGVTMLFLWMLLRFRRSRTSFSGAVAVGVLGLVVAAALWIGVDALVSRFQVLAGDDLFQRAGRLIVSQDTMRLIAANPGGIGIGNYRDFFREYQSMRQDLLIDHAHNDYLETTAEWGIPAALLLWGTVFYIFIRAVRRFISTHNPERQGILLGCIGGVFSILLHSAVDFNLQIPSNAILFFSLTGIALAASSAAPIEDDSWRATVRPMT